MDGNGMNTLLVLFLMGLKTDALSTIRDCSTRTPVAICIFSSLFGMKSWQLQSKMIGIGLRS